jgi:hypothetical protein
MGLNGGGSLGSSDGKWSPMGICGKARVLSLATRPDRAPRAAIVAGTARSRLLPLSTRAAHREEPGSRPPGAPIFRLERESPEARQGQVPSRAMC